MVKSGQVWTGTVVTKDATGALATPSVGPAGVLYVAGVADAASVTISGTNPYKWSVTLPALTAGQSVEMYITATIAGIATAAFVARDIADTKRVSDLADLDAAGTRSALGMAAANLDAQIGTLATAAALATVDGIVDAVLDDTALIEEIKAITDALDVTAVTLVATSNAGEITIKRTLNLAAVVSGLTIPADWTACYWTVKRSTDDPDADALIQILESNPGDADDGVQVLMGDAQEDGSDGSLTVNQALGTVTIALGNASTALLDDAVELVWDVKVHTATGKTQPGAGTATITTAVTRA